MGGHGGGGPPSKTSIAGGHGGGGAPSAANRCLAEFVCISVRTEHNNKATNTPLHWVRFMGQISLSVDVLSDVGIAKPAQRCAKQV